MRRAFLGCLKVTLIGAARFGWLVVALEAAVAGRSVGVRTIAVRVAIPRRRGIPRSTTTATTAATAASAATGALARARFLTRDAAALGDIAARRPTAPRAAEH